MERMRTNAILTAAVYALLGLLLLVWPGLTAGMLCSFIGGALLLSGIVGIVGYLLHRDMPGQLLTGIILAAGGIWISQSPGLITNLLPRLIGLLVLFHGIRNVRDTLYLRSNGQSRWGIELGLAVITLLAGVVLVWNPFAAYATLVRMLGIFLLYDGLSNLWIAFRLGR